jgi:glycosyltransferase involved in cell wall biosynthesis
MKKIAIVVQRYGAQINGGAEVHARMIAEKLKDKYDITVLTSRAVNYNTWEPVLPMGDSFENGVKIIRFDHPPKSDPKEIHLFNRRIRGRRWYQKLYRFLGKPAWYLRLIPQTIVKEGQDENKFFELQGPALFKLPDYLVKHESEYICYIFFTYLYYPTAIGMPLVSQKSIFIPTIHDEPPVYFPVFKKIIPVARWIFFNTDSEKKFSERLFNIENNKKDTVAVGINPVVYINDDTIEKKYTSLKSYILYVGRIDYAKGCDKLIEYFINYYNTNKNNISLIMVGNNYMNKIDHPNIHYLGFVSENEKAYLMKNALFLVIPSIYESLSLVLLESFFIKTPVLVNEKCEVLKEHVSKSGGGLSFSDYDQFREAVDFFKNSTDLRSQMGIKGYQYVLDNYCWDTVIQKFDMAIHDIETNNKFS